MDRVTNHSVEIFSMLQRCEKRNQEVSRILATPSLHDGVIGKIQELQTRHHTLLVNLYQCIQEGRPCNNIQDLQHLQKGIKGLIKNVIILTTAINTDKQKAINLLHQDCQFIMKQLEVAQKACQIGQLEIEKADALLLMASKFKKNKQYRMTYQICKEAAEKFHKIFEESIRSVDKKSIKNHAKAALLTIAEEFWAIKDAYSNDPNFTNKCSVSAYKIDMWRVNFVKRKISCPEGFRKTVIEMVRLKKHFEVPYSNHPENISMILDLLREISRNPPRNMMIDLVNLHGIFLNQYQNPPKTEGFYYIWESTYSLLKENKEALHQVDLNHCKQLKPMALPDYWFNEVDPSVPFLLETAYYWNVDFKCFKQNKESGTYAFQYAKDSFLKICKDSTRSDEHGVYDELARIKIEVCPKNYNHKDYGRNCYWDVHNVGSTYEEKAAAIISYLEKKLGKVLVTYLVNCTSLKMNNIIWI